MNISYCLSCPTALVFLETASPFSQFSSDPALLITSDVEWAPDPSQTNDSFAPELPEFEAQRLENQWLKLKL